MLDDRKQVILYALVHDYITTASPVGSSRLVQKYKLGISAATVRHEMAGLEEMGYLHQPHTSAGRIPTDEGYRFYVDSLKAQSGLTPREERFVQQSFLSLNKEMSDLMRKTSGLLSQLTNYVAIVLSPALKRSVIKHLDLVSMTPTRVLMVLITDTGCVAKHVIELKTPADGNDVRRVERALNSKISGKTAAQIRRGIHIAPRSDAAGVLGDSVLDAVLQLLEEEDEVDRVFLEGTSSILNQPEFGKLQKVQSLLETLEKGYTVLQVLGDVFEAQRIQVRIGSENPQKEIQECSLVATKYQLGEDTFGAVGLLGPTRMNYMRAISAVECIAQNLNEVLESMHS